MNTVIYKLNETNIDMDLIKKIGLVLREGGLVAFPTETVYGIGANALNGEAILNIYKAKGRPSDNPLIVHIDDINHLSKYAKEINEDAKKLMNEFWPGPLTLIFKKTKLIPDTISGGLDTVAIRIPSNKIARYIIKEAKVPIAAPSANISGRPSPTAAKHVIEDLYNKVDIIVDGGNTNIGLESTVLDVTDAIPVILRPGGVTKSMIEKVIGKVNIDDSLINKELVPKSPGMKYKHYAPKGSLIVVSGDEEKVVNKINEWVKEKEKEGYSVGVIATTETSKHYKCKNIEIIGDKHNHNQIAANLFNVLRKMDENNIDYIYSQAFSEEDIGMAIMNRLMKAAGNKKITI